MFRKPKSVVVFLKIIVPFVLSGPFGKCDLFEKKGETFARSGFTFCQESNALLTLTTC